MRSIQLALFSCLISIIFIGKCRGQVKPSAIGDFFVGRPAPEFHLKDLDGQDVLLSSFKGNVVVLEFWATWCGPCRVEIPAIEHLSKQFAKKNVVVIGINSEEPEDTIRRFVAKNKMTYRIVPTEHDPSVIRAYAANALPTVVIIDKDGIVAAYQIGVRLDTESILHDHLHHVLSAKYVAPEPKPIPNIPKPVATPQTPVATAESGPDPNWKPTTADEFLARGFARLRMHASPQATADAEEALKLESDSAVAWFLHGRAAYDDQNYRAAIDDFNKVIQGRPNWAEGYHYRALCYSYLGQHERAVPDYRTMLQLKPYAANGHNDLGWALRELQQIPEAKVQLEKAIELEPDYLRAHENLAILFAKQSDSKAELTELAIILHLSPNDQWAKDAKNAAQHGRPLPSHDDNSATSSMKTDTPRPDVKARLISKVMAEYTDEARRAGVSAVVLCSAVVTRDGTLQNIQIKRSAGFGLDESARLAFEQWKFEPATKNGQPVEDTVQMETNFRVGKANHENQTVSLEFTLPPGASRPQMLQGTIPENAKDSSDGELQIALTVDEQGEPQNLSVLKSTSSDWANSALAEIATWRFHAALLNGQPVAAHGTFDLVTRAPRPAGTSNAGTLDPNWQPQTPEEFLARGYARLKNHKYPQAEADADDALKLQPDNVIAWFLRGRAAYDAKDYSAALDAFERTIARRPDWPEAYRYRALVYSQTGQPQRAIPDFQRALELDPDFAAAHNGLAATYMDAAQWDAASSEINKALELEPNLMAARENRAKLLARQSALEAEQKELTAILGLAPNNQWAKDTLEAVHQKMQ